MKARICLMLVVLAAVIGVSPAQSLETKGQAPGSDRERLIGAWRLVSLREPGPDGTVKLLAGLKGTLIYTRDGHMSVEIMYPESQAKLSNDYVLSGYEASFGSYDVDETTHTVTHHVQGSVTRGLVGKDLPRLYRFTAAGRLIIRSVRPDEHWQAVWEHD